MMTITLDTNVLWDVVDPSREHHGEAAALLRLAGAGKLAIQITSAVDRDVPYGRWRKLILSLGLLPTMDSVGEALRMPASSAEGLFDILMHLLFPGCDPDSPRHAARASDAIHLIAHRRSGNHAFVTRDRAILERRLNLLRDFAIKVLSPEEVLGDLCGWDDG
ncbi:hypothetical protein JW921_05445 [Candidatus Fermentibacterales bacterium]|nr:hypothetical protein [Candidatus Fermentibacterales bacterium]